MSKVKEMLEALEKELRQNKQYSAADKLLPIIEEAGWIPCSEGLPKRDTRYLATIEIVPMERGSREIRMVQEVRFKNGRFYGKGNGNKVVAWMPLPEPFRGE